MVVKWILNEPRQTFEPLLGLMVVIFKFQNLVSGLLTKESNSKSLITPAYFHLLVQVLSEDCLSLDLGPALLPLDFCDVVHGVFEVDLSSVNNSLQDHCIRLLNLEVLV